MGAFGFVAGHDALSQERGRTMANFLDPHTRTCVRAANIEAFPYMLKATMTVMCPKCSKEANLGGHANEKALVVVCPECNHKESVKGRTLDEVVRALFTHFLNPG
jgi:DNA-directed RNA polymerase subunit RPC12/RpoP